MNTCGYLVLWSSLSGKAVQTEERDQPSSHSVVQQRSISSRKYAIVRISGDLCIIQLYDSAHQVTREKYAMTGNALRSQHGHCAVIIL